MKRAPRKGSGGIDRRLGLPGVDPVPNQQPREWSSSVGMPVLRRDVVRLARVAGPRHRHVSPFLRQAHFPTLPWPLNRWRLTSAWDYVQPVRMPGRLPAPVKADTGRFPIWETGPRRKPTLDVVERSSVRLFGRRTGAVDPTRTVA